jgi:pimeloyl-ACP methyl ester carboxylesterase
MSAEDRCHGEAGGWTGRNRQVIAATFVAGAMAGSLLLGAGGVASGAPSVAAVAPTSVVAPATGTVDWAPCPSPTHPDKQCAWVRVPKVYGRPGHGKVRIALARIPATGTPGQRIGSLFWDAGGPGGASTEIIDMIADRMSPAVRAQFDFVAFDPRGIGASTPGLGSCGSPWPIRAARQTDPNWRTVQRRSAALLAPANRTCARKARGIVATMGTNNVVRDLDRLRNAVGDRKLTLWGTSYGTRIGYVYALKYPQRVRAMVLDGSIDPTSGFSGLPEIGGTAEDLALQFMKQHYRPAYHAIMDTAASLTRNPVSLGNGDRFTRWNWLDISGGFVAFQNTWPDLAKLAAVIETAQGSGDQAVAARQRLATWKASPNSNEGGGFSVVNCLDYSDRLTGREQSGIAVTNDDQYPVFGGSLSLMYAMGCQGLRSLVPDPVPLITTERQRAGGGRAGAARQRHPRWRHAPCVGQAHAGNLRPADDQVPQWSARHLGCRGLAMRQQADRPLRDQWQGAGPRPDVPVRTARTNCRRHGAVRHRTSKTGVKRVCMGMGAIAGSLTGSPTVPQQCLRCRRRPAW